MTCYFFFSIASLLLFLLFLIILLHLVIFPFIFLRFGPLFFHPLDAIVPPAATGPSTARRHWWISGLLSGRT